MSQENSFQLSLGAAEIYDSQRVPAIFGPLAEATLDRLELPQSATVLDVACGTGVMARAVARRLKGNSLISGVDLNPAMIEVCRRQAPAGRHEFSWYVASVEELPFSDSMFDLVFCQQGLQFFPDKSRALREMRRVATHDGRLILTCWAAIPPYFEVVAEVLERRLSPETARVAVNPFKWNDAEHIRDLIAQAGFESPPPAPLPVARRMSGSPQTMRDELLSTPNEEALRGLPDGELDVIVSEVLDGVSRFREGDLLVMPQRAHLFECLAR